MLSCAPGLNNGFLKMSDGNATFVQATANDFLFGLHEFEEVLRLGI